VTVERAFDRAGPVLLGALAPLTFLAVDPWGWYPFGPLKWLVTSVLGLAGAALVLRRAPVRVPPPLLGALAVLVGWLAVAAGAGLDPLYAWIGTPERHFGLATWVLCAVVLLAGTALADPAPWASNRRRIDPHGPLRWGLAVAGLGVGGAATAEAVGWEPAVFDAGTRLTGTFGSAAYLGAAAALLLPVMAGLAADPLMSRRLRLAGTSGLPLLAVAAVGSGARSGWAGLMVAAVVTGWMRRSWLRAHAPVAVVAGAVGAVALVAVVAVTPVGGRLADLTDPAAPGGQGRLDEWGVAARVVADHPVTGAGPEGYRIAFGSAVDAGYEREHGREQQPDRAHAAPLDVALAGGLPGLAAWLAVVVLVGRSVLAALRQGPGWLVGVAAGLVAHLAGQLLLFPLAELEPVAWLLAGVVVGAAPGATVARTGRAVPRVVPVALGVTAALALVAGATDVRADRRAEVAATALARGDHRTAARAATDAARQRPDVVRLHVLAAAALVADEQGALAGIHQLDEALDISPGDPIVLLARARLLVDRAAATQVPAHIEAARAELDQLLDRDPYRAALWHAAARLALVEGDEAAADEANARADELTPPEERSQ
jgi:O-antigen ligase